MVVINDIASSIAMRGPNGSIHNVATSNVVDSIMNKGYFIMKTNAKYRTLIQANNRCLNKG